MIKRILVGSALCLAMAGSGWAGGHEGNPAVKARKGAMAMYGFYLGQLGGMARGNTEYDATVAQTAADNLAALTSSDMSLLFPEGTDSFSVDGTRAEPVIWDEFDAVMGIFSDLGKASTDLAAVAGDGLEALQGAMGPVGMACGACHKPYRSAQN